MAETDVIKVCKVCNACKSMEQFTRDAGTKDGRRGKCKECDKAYYRENADRYKAHAKRYRVQDPVATKEKDKSQHSKHKEKRNEQSARYRRENKERLKEYQRQWVSNNLEYFRYHNAKRRTLLTAAGDAYTKADVLNLLQKQKNCCAACKMKLAAKFDVDHVVPLSKGGLNDKSNIQILCIHCNRSKNAKDPIKFMQSLGYLL